MRQGYAGAGNSVDYSVFKPFNSQTYFHPLCFISNYDNQTNVEDCWLGDNVIPLADLNTTKSSVRKIWYDWVRSLVSNYSSKNAFSMSAQDKD
jgi:alpha-amylase